MPKIELRHHVLRSATIGRARIEGGRLTLARRCRRPAALTVRQNLRLTSCRESRPAHSIWNLFRQVPIPTVLIIDDHEGIAHAMAAIVRMTGCEPLVATDPREGLRLVKTVPVALVLLDNHMPELSGLDVLKAIKEDETLPTKPPVVLVTAAPLPEVRERAKALGAVEVLEKTDIFRIRPFVEALARCG